MKAFNPRPAAGVRKAGAAALSATEPIAIVGIGASANEVTKSRALLEALQPDTGLAFVFIQRPALSGTNHLEQALEAVTSMPVTTVERSIIVEPNQVYINPLDSGLFLQNGALHLYPYTPPGDYYIDQFLASLAMDQRERAIGVVMTDLAMDGAVGLSAIKSEGGLTCLHLEVAARAGISHTVEGPNGVDMIRSTTGLAEDLMRIARRRRSRPEPKPPARTQLEPVLALLRKTAGVDFKHYQTALLWRSVQRRMLIVDADALSTYIARLREEPSELQQLSRNILSSYTCFFRDPTAFEALKTSVLPELFAKCARYDSLRIWAPGCSTGEEVYSLAIVCMEVAEQIGATVPIVIFGSDISAALETAREGVYPKSIARQVSAQRLQEYFIAQKDGYRVAPAVRELCVFAQRNVITDPPFMNAELISCRNLLSDLDPPLRERVLPIFYLSLKTHGVLFLGQQEEIDGERRWFEPLDVKHRFYCPLPGAPLIEPSFMLTLPVPGLLPEQEMLAELTVTRERRRPLPLKEAERLLFEHFAPPGVLIDAKGKIQQQLGNIAPYINLAAGRGQRDVVSAARAGLQQPLRRLLQRARRHCRAIFRQRAALRDDDGNRVVLLSAMPLEGGRDEVPHCWLLFEDSAGIAAAGKPARRPARSGHDLRSEVTQLREELTATREGMETINAQLWTSYQDLQTLRERYQLNSGEQQKMAERLKTSERLLAEAEDEVATIGRELQAFTDDWMSLSECVPLAVVILTKGLRIRRFTPLAGKLLGLTQQSNGQLLPSAALDLDGATLAPLLDEVMARGVEHELTVRDRQRTAHRLRLRPLQSATNAIDGAMLLLTEVEVS